MQTDLRRRARREFAECLVEAAAWLPAADRALIEAVYRDGQSVAEYVRRQRGAGIDLWTERSARRRVRRLTTRLTSMRFAYVIAERRNWAPTRRRVAMAVVVQGSTLREAARSLGLSLHAVRRHVDAIDALAAESRVGAPGLTADPGARP